MGTITSIGFTGTQRGLTSPQLTVLRKVLDKIHETDVYEYHHGSCEGADDMFDTLIRQIVNPGSVIHIHPPLNRSKMVDCSSKPAGTKTVQIHSPKRYLDRNSDIVRASGMLVACPREKVEILRSGTWSTIRRARRKKIPYIIVWPDGDLEFSW
jgi:hypothetical protein